jgi:hypothetical protein
MTICHVSHRNWYKSVTLPQLSSACYKCHQADRTAVQFVNVNNSTMQDRSCERPCARLELATVDIMLFVMDEQAYLTVKPLPFILVQAYRFRKLKTVLIKRRQPMPYSDPLPARGTMTYLLSGPLPVPDPVPAAA